MNAYLWILVWAFILFIVCEVLQYQEWKELEKKYFEEKRKAPESKGLEAICDLAYSLSPEHRKIKNKVDTYDMLDGMTFDQIKAYVWEYEKFADKLFDLVESYEEGN